MNELTLPYLKITPREDVTQYQHNLIEDIIIHGLGVETYFNNDIGQLYINLDSDEESEDGIIVNAFRLGAVYERLELRYGIQEPFTFIKITDEDDEDDEDDKGDE
jgi:hypothetical protein